MLSNFLASLPEDAGGKVEAEDLAKEKKIRKQKEKAAVSEVTSSHGQKRSRKEAKEALPKSTQAVSELFSRPVVAAVRRKVHTKPVESASPASEEGAPQPEAPKPEAKKHKPSKKESLAEKAERDARSIFVGNVPLDTKAKVLKRLFGEFGAVESVRFRSAAFDNQDLPKKASFALKRFHESAKSMNAYVVFQDADSVSKALVLNNTLLGELHIRVDRASEPAKFPRGRSVFVGNLPLDIADEALRTHFASCGDIEAVRVVRDRYTRIGKGVAYVQFADRSAVPLALNLAGLPMSGRELRVSRIMASPKDDSTRPAGAGLHGAALRLQKNASKAKPKTSRAPRRPTEKVNSKPNSKQRHRSQQKKQMREHLAIQKKTSEKLRHRGIRSKNLTNVIASNKMTSTSSKNSSKRGSSHNRKK